jgi:hypothetical protein
VVEVTNPPQEGWYNVHLPGCEVNEADWAASLVK